MSIPITFIVITFMLKRTHQKQILSGFSVIQTLSSESEKIWVFIIVFYAIFLT